MNGQRILSRLLSDQRGAAAEFALILPLAMLLFLGLIDAGRYLYTVNRAEKATQVGARFAIVTDPVASGLAGFSFVGADVDGVTLTQGDRIPAGALGTISCNGSSCSCTGCPTGLNGTTRNAAAFNRLLGRMQDFMPEILPANLVIEYRGSGLGYAGDPNGMDIAPLVTVRLRNMTFTPFFLLGGIDIDLPDFSYTLTMEDGQGTGSN